MNTFKSALLFFLTGWVGAFAQTATSYVPKIVPPSPQAASLTRYVDIPVSYYTGTANISIPIYTAQQGKASLPISISYHPSGIKVADEASQVGLGWALNAGGVISRTVMGEDDFTLSRYFSAGNNLPTNYFPTPHIQLGTAIPNNQSAFNFNFHSQQSGPGQLPLKVEDGTNNEYEPDIYNFNFAGYSGKFIISRTKEIIMNEKSDIRIRMIEANNGTDISWEIKIPDGTTYLFNQKETFRNATGGASVSSWYLTQVTSPEGAVISLSYNAIADAFNYPQGAITETEGIHVIGETCNTGENQPPVLTHTIGRIPPKYISTVYLNEITFQNGSVKFIFDNREDLSYDKRLKTVEIYNKPGGVKTLLKAYDFNYAYFDGTADADVPGTSDGSGSVSKRLKLLSLTEKSASGSVLKPHLFEYFEASTGYYDLPAKTSFAQDHWGYYNGQQGNTSLIPKFTTFSATTVNIRDVFGQLTGTQRDTGPDYIKAFSLKKITYPTGGYTEFNFEAHDYDVNNSNKNDYSFAGNIATTLTEKNVRFMYNTNTGNKGTIQNFEVDFSRAATAQDGQTTTLKLNAFVRLANPTQCSSVSSPGQVYFELIDKATGISKGTYDMYAMQECPANPNGSTTPCIVKGCSGGMTGGISHANTIYNIPPGKYIWRAKASDGNGAVISEFAISFYWFEPLEATEGAMKNAGGLRVKTITAHDGVQSNVKTFTYKFTETGSSGQSIEKSKGRLMTKPQYTYAEDRSCVTSGPGGTTGKNFLVILRTSNSIIPLSTSAGGSVVGYDQVVVSYGANGENGKSIFYYDNQSDVVNNFSYYRPPLISSKPFKSNGNLLKQEDFVKSGSGFVKVKEANYDYYLSTPTYQYAVEMRDIPLFAGGAIFTQKRHGFFYPAMIKNWNYLKSEKTKVYDLKIPGTSIETVKEYYYNNTNYTQLSQTKASDSRGRNIITAYKYPFDYSTGVYPAMVTKNMVSPVIEETTSIENGATLTWVSTEYFNPSGSLYVPKKVDKKIGTGAVFTLAEFLTYDARGNLLTFKENGGATTKLDYYGTADAGKTDLLKSKTEADGTTVSATTTYNYKSLVGVESITDPAGKVTWYNYDIFGRLSDIRENTSTGNLIKSFHYNYANQGGWSSGITDNPAVDAPSSPGLVSDPGNICGAVTKVRLKWRTTYFNRLNGAKIQGSNDGSTWTDLYTINVNGIDGWLEFPISTTTVYGHIRYVSAPIGYGELMEIEFYSGTVKLTGTKFGSDPNVSGMPWQYAIDGDESTTWHGEYQGVGAHPGASNFVGLSLQCATTCIKPDIIKTAGATVCQSSNETVTLMASGCSGNVTWFLNGVQVGSGATYTTNLAGTYTAKCSSGSCTSDASAGLVVTQTTTCAPPNYSRVLIVGNSITKLIPQSGTDGWQSPALTAAGGWGRASSTQAKDFAHILETRFKQLDPNAKVLPLWEAPFERDYISSPAGWLTYDYTALQNRIVNGFSPSPWKPDLIIVRLGENVVNGEVELNNFKGAYNTLINKILEVSSPGARVILTNSMWPDQPLANTRIQQVATERALPFVDLSDMISNPVYLAGNDPVSMSAFPNNTGDRHPGDAGMLEIADRIWSKVRNVSLPSNIGGNITKVRLYPRSETCCIARITGSVIQGSNDISNANGWTTLATISETPIAGWNEYAIRTTTAWRYLRFLAGPNGYGDIKELEFYNGNVKLTGSKFGSATAYQNNPTSYGYGVVFDGQLTNVWSGTAPGPQNYAGLDLGAGCSALTASVLSPANNASLVGTASTTTAGRVTTAISVTTCVPTGTTITSVEVWAATTAGTFPNRMGYAVADASRPGVYTLSAAEGTANGKWPIAYLDPGTYRFYAVVNTASTSLTTAYNTITLTAPVVTGCPALTASVLSPANNASVVGTASTTTAGRVTTAISVTTCVPTGTTITSVEVWAATTTGTFPNRMGYAVADASRPGVYTLSAAEGTANGKWPIAYLDPGTYRFYAVVNTASTSLTTAYNTITLTAPVVTGCPALTASVLSPANNASVVGTASTTTAGRVTTAISVTTCVPTGTTITSVEVWAATTTGTFPNRMGYAVADASRPGVYTLSAAEGNANGKWPIAYLDPGTYRFYAVVNTASTSLTTAYNTITLTAPVVTGCPALTASVLSPANNASVVGTASTTTAGRVTTAISVTTCVPTGTTITSVEVWAATTTGTFPNRMGYAVADASRPGVYTLSAAEGTANGKWPIPYLEPGTWRFYAVVNTGTTSLTTAYNTITLTAPTGCSVLTGSVLSPANNASVVGTASTTTAGRVTTAISVTTCVPTGTTITSVEVWAATTTGTFPNRMGYAVADASRPGVYTLSAAEGTANGKWPIPYLEPGTWRFYAVVNTGTTSLTTAYNTITLTAPTGCSVLTGSVLSPANNASVVGTASTTTAGRVTTAISVTTCVPTGTTITSVEVWAATTAGTFPNRMGYAVADASRPGVYTLSAAEGTANGKWPIPYLDPGTYRFYAVVNTASTSLTTAYNTITLTAP